MPPVSQLELAGSPYEQGSRETVTYSWTPVLAAGEACTAAQAAAFEYDPAYPNDTKDVSSAVLATGTPTVSNGTVSVTVQALTPGYEYRVEVWSAPSATHVEERFLRVRCQV